MLQDLLFAIRQIARAPAFALTAVLTLGLGTGANTAIFSLINGFLRPLPVPSADRIVVLASETPGDETGFRYRFSYPALADYRRQTDVFSDVFGFDTRIGGLGVDGKTTQFVYAAVTGNFFSGLAVAPATGRLFEPGEGEHSGGEPLIVIGHAYWQKRFGGDPGVVGTIARLDGQAARIIGVAPAGFRGLLEGTEMDGYTPLGGFSGRSTQSGQIFHDRTIRFLTVVGRLQSGITVPAAQSAMDVVASRLAAAYPASDGHTAVRVMPEPLARPFPLRFLARVLPVIKILLFVLAALVLLLACMNVANLLLVRATVRQREMAVRAALGSGRGRLIRLLLAESLLLAVLGAGVGLLLGKWAASMLVSSIDLGMSIPLTFDTSIDWRVFANTFATALATGVFVGLLPALRASRAKVTDLLHDGDRAGSAGGNRQRLRSVLVVAQVAGSLLLLIVAGLFIRNLQRAQWIDVGFDPDRLLNVRLDPHQVGYDQTRSTTFYDELERRLRAVPGVESVSLAFAAPLGYVFGALAIQAEGQVPKTDEPPAVIGFNSVSPSYFDTMRLPLVRGRAFTDDDTATSLRVAVVNQTLAARLWPAQDAIGKRFLVPGIDDRWWLVVGIAHDSKYIAVFEDPLPYFYLPLTQNPTFMRVVQLRSAQRPDALGTIVQHEIAALDPDMPSADMQTMKQTISGGMGFLLFKTGAMQAAALGLLGLLLAVVGVYGVVSYGASQRTREIGIRLALGASPGHVRALVLGQGARLVVAGVLIGLAAMLVMTRVIGKLLVLVSAADPLTFGVVTSVLAAIALLACYLPARRAMRVEPMVALRHE